VTSDAHPLSASLRGGESGASYEILGKLATGGMAELFLARTPLPTGRPGPVVVLKRILPHLAEDPEFIRMFRDEAYLAATLRHPNIVQVFDIGKQGEDYFFTMEYVHGENLRAILRSAQKRGESIPLTHILTIALGITAALHHAHQQTDDQGQPLHIVHRDVSPTNVLVAYDGSVKIVDFGIAKAAAGTHVTQAGMLKGKASYMSPEQCRAGTVDRRSDVFAIGILLYEMTTLTRLFKGENELAILHQVLSGAAEPPSQRRPGYPPELERIVMKALASDPANRYPTAEALQADLMRFGQQNGIRPSNPALGQFLRGLFGNKPLPWSDAPARPNNPAAPAGGAQPRPPQPRPPQPPRRAAPPQPPSHRGMRQVEDHDDADKTTTHDPSHHAVPAARPNQPPRPAAPRPSRGPGSRAPAAKAWRPGGARKAPPPPPSRSPAPPTGPTTAKQVRLGGQQAHAPSRPTAPRGGAPSPASSPAPPAAPPRPPAAAARPPAPARPQPQARPSAASYAPPPPDYDIDPEESKTAIASPKAFDPMQEAKTKVSGTSAEDVRAFIAAAPAANLSTEDTGSMAVKTQVAPQRSEDAVAAFLAAAPPAQLASDNPSPLVAKTQIAPATAAEIKALAEAAAKAAGKPEARDLFSAPAAPTRPGGKPSGPAPQSPAAGRQPPAQTGNTLAPSRPGMPSPADLPPPGGGTARPSMPSPSSLPPPGGSAAAASAPTPPPPSDLPPPGGGAPGAAIPANPANANRRDTIMNAPAQPAALGGAVRTVSPGAPARAGQHADPSDPSDMDEVATMRMTVDQALHDSGRSASHTVPAPSQAPAVPVQAQHMPQPVRHPPAASPLPPPQAPIQHWQNAQPQNNQAGHTVPMPMVDLDDEPIVVPGRNSKLIAMIVTVVVGLTLGATGVWFFLLD